MRRRPVAAQQVVGAVDLDRGVIERAQDAAAEEAVAVALDEHAPAGGARGQVPDRMAAFARDVDREEAAGDRAVPEARALAFEQDAHPRLAAPAAVAGYRTRP